jgi:hypothetical protein
MYRPFPLPPPVVVVSGESVRGGRSARAVPVPIPSRRVTGWYASCFNERACRGYGSVVETPFEVGYPGCRWLEAEVGISLPL